MIRCTRCGRTLRRPDSKDGAQAAPDGSGVSLAGGRRRRTRRGGGRCWKAGTKVNRGRERQGSSRAEQANRTERSHALAMQLLSRYGILLREQAAAENVPGGFSAVYDVLKALEEIWADSPGLFCGGAWSDAVCAACGGGSVAAVADGAECREAGVRATGGDGSGESVWFGAEVAGSAGGGGGFGVALRGC